VGLEVGLDRLDTRRDDVPEEEEEDAGLDRVQGDARPYREVPEAADRQAEEDREACDGAENQGLRRTHVRRTLHQMSVGPPLDENVGSTVEMAASHGVDDYLETIYFLAFPIGEYRPAPGSSQTIAARVGEMLGVSRASAGEMLKRLEAEGLVERGEHKEAILTPAGTER